MPIGQEDSFVVRRDDAERFLKSLRVAINVICMDAPLPGDDDYDEDGYEFMDEIHSFTDRLEAFVSGVGRKNRRTGSARQHNMAHDLSCMGPQSRFSKEGK